MAARQDLTTQDTRALVKSTPGQEPPTEFEMDDYQNADAVTEEELEAMDREVEPEGEPEEAEPQPATPQPDWRAIAQRQAEELAELRAQQQARKQEDLEKRVNELPEEERIPFLLNYQKDQDRAREIEAIRAAQVTEYPLASLIFGKVTQRFELELDDPDEYREAIAGLDTDFNMLIAEIVEERVKQEMDKFYTETGQQWGVNKLGDAQPRPLQPRNPIRNQYEQSRKAVLQGKKPVTVEDLQTLVRQREAAKR